MNEQKGIHEDMTVMELAIMMNNGFNSMFDLYKVLRDDIKEVKVRISNLEIDISNLKTDFKVLEKTISRLEKRTENIESNMVTSFEFKNLILRADRLEEIVSI